MYVYSLKSIFRAMFLDVREIPWFLNFAVELIRPPEPIEPSGTLAVRSLPDSPCLDCCDCTAGLMDWGLLQCFTQGDVSMRDEYVRVARRDFYSACYFRSMYISLSGRRSLGAFLLCGKCCSCSRNHYPDLKEKIGQWKEGKEHRREERTQQFFREEYSAEGYEELKERYINQGLVDGKIPGARMDRTTETKDEEISRSVPRPSGDVPAPLGKDGNNQYIVMVHHEVPGGASREDRGGEKKHSDTSVRVPVMVSQEVNDTHVTFYDAVNESYVTFYDARSGPSLNHL